MTVIPILTGVDRRKLARFLYVHLQLFQLSVRMKVRVEMHRLKQFLRKEQTP